jgi:NitT/TauT family transport system ATP-binding protein
VIAEEAPAPPGVKIAVTGVTRSFPPASKRSRRIDALHGITCVVHEHEIVGLLGPSGCGKSTLLNLIAGFDRPDRGEIRVGGRPVMRPGPDRMMVFQAPALFLWLSVWDNLVFGPRHRGEPRRDYEPRANALLAAVGLAGREHDYPYQLSGGMRQRLQLARALINRPDVLLMDEPFGALDAQMRGQMQELLLRVWGLDHPAVLLVTHDPEEALFLCQRLYVMGYGTIREALTVPFPFPRTLALVGQPEFARLKYRLLQILHSGRNGSAVLETPGADRHREVRHG